MYETATGAAQAQCAIPLNTTPEDIDVAIMCDSGALGSSCQGGVAEGDGWQIGKTLARLR